MSNDSSQLEKLHATIEKHATNNTGVCYGCPHRDPNAYVTPSKGSGDPTSRLCILGRDQNMKRTARATDETTYTGSHPRTMADQQAISDDYEFLDEVERRLFSPDSGVPGFTSITEVYFTNALKCPAINNDYASINYHEARSNCTTHFAAELEHTNTDVVVAFGDTAARTAADALSIDFGNQNLSKFMGTETDEGSFEFTVHHGSLDERNIALVASYHWSQPKLAGSVARWLPLSYDEYWEELTVGVTKALA